MSRREFRKSAGLDRREFGPIEYLLRRGKRQLDIMASPAIKDIHD